MAPSKMKNGRKIKIATPGLVLMVSILLPCLIVGTSLAQQPKEEWVAAQNLTVHDSLGFQWDFTNLGVVADGSNDCFDNGLNLTLNNGVALSWNPALVNPATNEFLFTSAPLGGPNGIVFTRRVWVDRDRGVARYLEIIKNPDTKPLSISLEIQSRLGGNAQQVLSNMGTPMQNGTLGTGINGLCALRGQGRAPSVYFILADPQSKLRPNLMVQSNRQIHVTYPAQIPPGKEIVIMHLVAQRGGQSAPILSQTFESILNANLFKDLQIPEKMWSLVANFIPPQNLAPGGTLSSEFLLSGLNNFLAEEGITRSAEDQLLLADGATMKGKVTAKNLKLSTAFGKIELPYSRIAAISTQPTIGSNTILFLRTGEIYSGTIEAFSAQFTTSSDWKLDLSPGQFKTIVSAESEEDANLPEADFFLEMRNGDRLLLQWPNRSALSINTPWTSREIPVSSIRQILSVREPYPGHLVQLQDGSQFFCFLDTRPWKVDFHHFGSTPLIPQAIQNIIRIRSNPADTNVNATGSPAQCKLSGEDTLFGTLASQTLEVATSSQKTITLRRGDVQLLERIPSPTGSLMPFFRFELNDGSQLTGAWLAETARIQSNELQWDVPIHLIQNMVPNPPTPPTADPSTPSDQSEPAPPPLERML